MQACVLPCRSVERPTWPGTQIVVGEAEAARRWLYLASRHATAREAVGIHRWSCPCSRNATAGMKRASVTPLGIQKGYGKNTSGKTHMRRGILSVLAGLVHGRQNVSTTTPLEG